MNRPIYWAIAAATLVAIVWILARREVTACPQEVAGSMAADAPASRSSLPESSRPTAAKQASAKAGAAPAIGTSPGANEVAGQPVTAAVGNTFPIDVYPGFEFLAKPAAEIKDTDGDWGAWRRHQKLQSESRDEAWAPRMEAALRSGVQAALIAHGMDIHRIEMPVLECRSSGCEVQAVGLSQDDRGFDFQDALGQVLRGPLGSEFDLDNVSWTMMTRDDRKLFLTHLMRKGN